MIKQTKELAIHITRGDTLSFGISFTGLDQDLETAYFTCKTNIPNTEPVQMFQKSLGDGISKIENGKYAVRIAPEDTEDMDVDTYIYDLEIGVNNDIYTLIKGNFYVEQEVTR